jgi:23S rRNA pseudouridine1911/1915/1917 synthase
MEIRQPKIIFQDETILVIEKPTGMVVNRAQSVQGETLQDWISKGIKTNYSSNEVRSSRLDKARTSNNKEFVDRVGLVHRLDKETSGLMVIAKNVVAFENLKNQFKQRQVLKKYLTLVHGKVSPTVGNIRVPIKRNPFNRMHFGVFVDGRPAETNYQVLNYYQNPREKNKSKKYFSLVEVTPKTGRTHQIRVHFSHLHHPVVADDLYGGRKTNRADRFWCPRLFLHAAYLEFSHPVNGQRLKFSSTLPVDLKQALEKREKIKLEN